MIVRLRLALSFASNVLGCARAAGLQVYWLRSFRIRPAPAANGSRGLFHGANRHICRASISAHIALAAWWSKSPQMRGPPQNPYRSLAGLVRQNGGFCKSFREFAEFAWADWFRSKFPTLDNQNLPSDPNDKNATVDEAVEMAHSSEAQGLPGYSAAKCQ